MNGIIHPSQLADLWLSQFNTEFLKWIQSGYLDQSAWATAFRNLDHLFRRAPERAAEVQQLAVVLCSLGRRFVSPDLVLPVAKLGLAAGTANILDSDEAKNVRQSLLIIWLADLQFNLNRQIESLDSIRVFEASKKWIPKEEPLLPYLTAYEEFIRAKLYELSLKYYHSHNHYWHAMRSLEELLKDKAKKEQCVDKWIAVMFGQGATLAQLLRPQINRMVEEELMSLCFSTMLSQMRTLTGDEQGRFLGEMAEATQQKALKWTLPGDFYPLDLIQIVTVFRHRLKAQRAQKLVDLILANKSFQHLSGKKGDWEAPVFALLALLYTEDEEWEDAERCRNYAIETVKDCSSSILHALTHGYLLYEHRTRVGYLTREVIAPFFRSICEMSQEWRQTKISSRLKLLLEVPLEAVIHWAVHAYMKEQGTKNRIRLSVFLDILRRPTLTIIPFELWLENKNVYEKPSINEGLVAALDYLQRISSSLRMQQDTAVLILQTLEDQTLFICITSGSEIPVHTDFAEANYRSTTRELSEALMEELDFITASNGGIMDDGLEILAMNAYGALPVRVQSIIQRVNTLLIVPDLRANEDSVSFELMHDGESYLGASKFISRFTSLRHLVRTLEAKPILSAQRRAVIAGIPDAGESFFPYLDFVESEVEDLRNELQEIGWDSPEIKEEELSSVFLTDCLEYIDILHLAGHGETVTEDASLLLPHGNRLKPDDLLRKPFSNLFLVYLNTCFLAETNYLGGGVSYGLAHTFIEQGAFSVIANLSPVSDKIASRMALEFYGHLSSKNVGEALRESRAHFFKAGVSPALWGTIVLFGSPETSLIESESRQLPPSAVLTDELLDHGMGISQNINQLPSLLLRAIQKVEKSKDDTRLFAAVNLILKSRDWYSSGDLTTVNEWDLELAAALANELNHSTTTAAIQCLRINRFVQLGEKRKAKAAIEELLPLLNVLVKKQPIWEEFRINYLSYWQKLERQKGVRNDIAIVGTDNPAITNAERKEREQIIGQFEARSAQEKIKGEEAGICSFENNILDVLWNAVVIGHRDRFEDDYERGSYGRILASKFRKSETLSKESEPYAVNMLSGLLAVVWSKQSRGYFSKAQAGAFSEGLLSAVKDIQQFWSPPKLKSLLDTAKTWADKLESTLERMEKTSLQELPAISEQEEISLIVLGKSLLDEIIQKHPGHINGCTAFLLGEIVQKNQYYWLDHEQPEAMISRCLNGIFNGIIRNNYERYLPNYFYLPNAVLKKATKDILSRWALGLSHEEYERQMKDDASDFSTHYDPMDSIAFGATGNTYISVDHGYQLAEQYLAGFGRPTNQHPPEGYLYAEKGILAQMIGSRESALKYFNKAIELHPDYGEAFACRAILYEVLDRRQEAEQDKRKAVKLGVPEDLVKLYEGSGEQEKIMPVEPIQELQEPYKQPTNPILEALENDFETEEAEDYIQRGSLYIASGDYEKAIDDYSKAIEMDPNIAKAYAGRSIALISAGRDEEAEKDIEQAIALGIEEDLLRRTIEKMRKNLESQPGIQSFEEYLGAGLYHLQIGEWDIAIKAFDLALNLSPKSLEALVNRAICLLNMGHAEEALLDYNKILQLDPEFGGGYASRALAFTMIGNDTAAKKDIDRAVELGIDRNEVMEVIAGVINRRR